MNTVVEPYLQTVPEDITHEQAIAELQTIWPNKQIAILPTPKGNLRLVTLETGRQGIRYWFGWTVRPTVREIVAMIRWYKNWRRPMETQA